MEQQEYGDLVRRLVAVSEQHETRLADMQRLITKIDTRQDDLAARQQVHEDIMKSLAATLVKQDTINDRLTTTMERLDRTNERLATSIERLEGILVGIRDMLRRGNGSVEG
jgi:ABC-type transporter Mla subunit MlaD